MHRPFLEHTIAQVSKQSRGIQASGIEADFVHLPEIISMVEGPRFIISFGSNLFNHHDPLEQLRPIADKMSVGDHIYLSIDCHGINDSQKIKKSYETREFTQFIKGTLDRMPGYRPEQWDLSSKVQDKYGCRHFFCLEANEDVLIGDMFYPKNKIIEFFPCYKSTKDKVDEVCSKLDLAVSRIFEREGTKMSE